MESSEGGYLSTSRAIPTLLRYPEFARRTLSFHPIHNAHSLWLAPQQSSGAGSRPALTEELRKSLQPERKTFTFSYRSSTAVVSPGYLLLGFSFPVPHRLAL
ncbi:hypothetical protein AVEN_72825-1 [Araneus ventricosus]|uniref:Uncharacterized protein n=1 Tax=Araneus ventricosus TaxID=182803 RepID=A0A4Y2FBV7_ARAVE|nr:hypothetical protein AVEN_72825-1 [Araneus ventricosus]